MNIIRIIAAASIAAATLGAATAADARDYRHDDRGHHYGRDYNHGYNRGYQGNYRHGYHGRNCHTEWRHHQRMTICR